MTSIANILCAVDFSEYSVGGLQAAIGISRRFHARLYVYHSIHSPRDPIYGTTEFHRGRDLEKKVTELQKKIAVLMAKAEVEWKAVISLGDPVVESSRMCNELNIDLVVAASHGISGLKRVFLGTVVERLARNLSRPLLVIHTADKGDEAEREKPFAGFKKIVVGCDFHADSMPCLQQAVYFAESFQTSLHLLHVMESPVNEGVVDSSAAPYGEVQQKLLCKMNERLVELLPNAVRNRLELRTGILTGLPAEGIVNYAAQWGAELIVVGVRGHRAVDKIVIGSSTEAVLRKAPCAVLAVPCSAPVAPKQKG
jgi:nucleotide-binding universal stress UspA family protein